MRNEHCVKNKIKEKKIIRNINHTISKNQKELDYAWHIK